jgi:hypothetical protein
MSKNPQSQKNLDLSEQQSLVCEKCGHNYFSSVFIVKRTGAGLIPIPVFCCARCNHVNDEFEPSSEKLKNVKVFGA